MKYRFVDCIAIAIALIWLSPLWGADDPRAASSDAAAPAAAESAEAEPGASAAPSEGEAPAHTEPADAGHSPAASSGEEHAMHDAGHDSQDASHGDPHDLSHANASPAMNSPQEFRSDLAIWTFVVFICLLVILGKFAWGPIMEGLDKREQSIAAMIEEARQGQEKAAEQLKQYEAKLAAAGEEARELVAQARKDAETAKDRILVEAQQAADRQRQRAIEEIQVAKNVALLEISQKGVDLAVNLAGRIVRRQLNAADHKQLIDEAMNQLSSRN